MAVRLSTGGIDLHIGNQVYENFGYVRGQKTKSWDELDGPVLLRDKYDICRFKRATDGVDGCHIPGFRRSQRSGPRAMRGEEQDARFDERKASSLLMRDHIHTKHPVYQEELRPVFYNKAAIFSQWAEHDLGGLSPYQTCKCASPLTTSPV